MANIIVCSKFPQDLRLEAKINGEIVKFVISGAKQDRFARQDVKNNLIGATAMTTVDEDLFNAWKEQHPKSALIENNVIFTSKDTKSANSQAKELKGEKTGLEGLNQDGDDRVKGVKKVKKSTDA